MEKKDRYVIQAGWIDGRLRDVGDVVSLTDDEVQYLRHQVGDKPPRKRSVASHDKRPAPKKSEVSVDDDKRRT